MILGDLGYSEYWKGVFESGTADGLVPARVCEAQRGRYAVAMDEGQCYARVRGAMAYGAQSRGDYPAVGDFVRMAIEQGDAVIYSVLERRSSFERIMGFQFRKGERGEEVIAANFDFALIISSLNKDLNPRRIERYLTSAWQSGAEPVIILTKADIPYENDMLREVRSVSAGATVHITSVVSGEGLEDIERYFSTGKTSLLIGSSGVGKSSLINRLAGEELMKVGGIREDDSRGRHTTTHRQLFVLPRGGVVIDTPGMRELGMWDAEDGLDMAFADVSELAEACRFKDCMHISEPGCAVLEAVDTGELSKERLESYRKLEREVKRAAERAASNSKSTKEQRNREIAKVSRQRKKSGYKR